ncbi:MAG TPA: DUF3048 domain-containing protein [Kineosporiaceae bacterium]|nr:DUF3048 domain-containing protein [Kineosporiaceae bacterium]
MDPFDRRTVVLGLLGVAGVALAGCSGDAPASAALNTATVGVPTASPSASNSPARWPLSGKLVTNASAPNRPAVAVKVPDNRNEHPQVGLDQADIVFVELDGYRDADGYASTRLVPVFHSRLPNDVGPVRSMRPVDVPLLSPVDAIIASTGAAGWVVNYIKHFREHVEGSLTYLETKGSGAYSIDPSRVRTYQGVTYYDRAVVCHPRILAKQTKRFGSGPQQAYFPFAETDLEVSTASGEAARRVRVPWKKADSYDMGYQYDETAGRYLRSMPWGPHVLADGSRVSTDNILVVRATQRYAKLYAGSGHKEPIHEIIDAAGTFYYFHGGRYVSGTWTKGANEQPFDFTLTDGQPLKMAPGQTYVELPSADAQVRITA